MNEKLITMYCDIGEYISKQSPNSSYGDVFAQKLVDFLSENYPELKGFNRRGLYRMKQFYELYKEGEKGVIKKAIPTKKTAISKKARQQSFLWYN